MKGLENEYYLMMLLISNAVAIFQLIAALRWHRVARVSFILLFAWASWVNWRTAQLNPQVYLDYAGFALVPWYRQFINGWFSNHILLVVGFIATCQALIALSLFLKGAVYKMGTYGAVLFFVSILPLGVGAGFPCTAIMAISILILFKKEAFKFVWQDQRLSWGKRVDQKSGWESRHL